MTVSYMERMFVWMPRTAGVNQPDVGRGRLHRSFNSTTDWLWDERGYPRLWLTETLPNAS